MAELKEVEAEHKAKSDASLENLAKLLALNKIQKTSDKSYLEVSKQYVAFMRKKMSAAGKKLITNQDMVMFKQLTEVQFKLSSNKKHPDIAVKIGEEVGESFRRFIRNNFTELKKEEQMYLAKTTDVREKATRRASIFRAQAFRQNDDENEIESDANDLESEVQTSHQSEAKTSQKKEKVTSERGDSIEDQIRDEIASEEVSEEDIFEIMTEPDKVDHSQGKKIDKPKLKSDQIELIYSEDEIPTLQKQEYKLSNVDHPAGLLESEVREDIKYENKFFQSKEGEEMLGNQNNLGLDSFELEKKEDYGLIDSLQNDEENIWASAMDGNDLLRLPTSKDDDEEFDIKAKQRRGTEAIRVIAESQVEDGSFPKSMSMNMKRGGSASSVFTNNRESIVKRLPIPALDTGSNNNTDEEIKMTDEGTSEDLIKIMPTED